MTTDLTPSQENSVRLALDLARALVRIRELEDELQTVRAHTGDGRMSWAQTHGWETRVADACEVEDVETNG